LVPEDDVRDEAALVLPGEQGANLVRRSLGIRARPDDRVEARVPEPLERVDAEGGNREPEPTAVEQDGLRVRREELPRRLLDVIDQLALSR
jgi:hypothetical protein